MKDFYEKPLTTNHVVVLESMILASSNESETEECDCFAHKGNHSKCGNGCHNSGKKETDVLTDFGW